MPDMTDKQRARLAQLAGAVAIEAPIRRGKYSSDAKVPWDLIEKIRAVYDEMGFDWKAEAEKVQREYRHNKWKNLPPALRGEEPPAPDDTPSLDDSFHRHEMDID